jgi:predicted outer membrane repeat protein
MIWSSLAFAATWSVPGDVPDLEAVAAVAVDGDVIELGPGDWEGTSFSVNVEIVGEDGAVITSTLSSTSVLAVSGVDFEGGAPCLRVESGALWVSDVLFQGCASERGSALVAETSQVTLADALFVGNRSTQAGGAVWAHGGVLTAESCTFESNHSTYGTGGAIHAVGVDVELTETDFTGNSGYHSGGAVHLQSGTLTVQGGQFSGNKTVYGTGGAIHTGGASDIDSAGFENNSAYGGGGCVYAAPDGEDLLLSSATFASCSTTYGSGGALAVTGAGSAGLVGVDLADSKAYEGGGAVSVVGTGAATLEQVDARTGSTTYGVGGLFSIRANAVSMTAVSAREGSAHQGGGVLFVHANSLVADALHVQGGVTTYGTGGAALLEVTEITLSHSVFGGGQSTDAGGLAATCTSLDLTNNDFVDNHGAGLNAGCGGVAVNNLFAWNTGESSSPVSFTHSLVWEDPSTLDASPVSEDPLFVDAFADLNLQEGSPAIDAGDPALLDSDGSTSDIGAYPRLTEPEDTGGSTDDTDAPDDTGVNADDTGLEGDVVLKGRCGCGGPGAPLGLLGLLLALVSRRR